MTDDSGSPCDGYMVANNKKSAVSALNADSLNNFDNTQKFLKYHKGYYMVGYNFAAYYEQDISVQRGEIVAALNDDDADWMWTRKANGQEGFVPKNYLFSVAITSA